ncbi:MAG: dihydrodipicolinate synthase family protein, partial [Bifidobacteriaceae bacterium]|nr:dihydrodipicolinate synthase family protein [Bifidobacteriaceae bacterium]
MEYPFGRIITALVTPMHADGTVDTESAKKLASHIIQLGGDGILVNGTTGEASTTHLNEKLLMIETLKSEFPNIPIMAGAGSNDTIHSISMAKESKKAGADAILVVAPYYLRPSQDGIFEHYKAIAESVDDTPIIIYDVPGRTGVSISLD